VITPKRIFWLYFVLITALAVPAALASQADYNVVINEIHYNPDVKTELVEFVELYNRGPQDIDLSGWYFSNGISYQFGAGATLPAGGYIIVAQNLAYIQTKWNTGRTLIPADSLFGPFDGKLSNDGENIELHNADGEQIDRVDYQLGFPWPTVGDPVAENQPGTGYSIQLLNPFIDNDLAGSWRSAPPTPAASNEMVYLENTPPHIRQVNHSPKQPKSGEIVTITAKVTDSDGVADVTLSYQIVEPGNYINLKDSQYYTNWTDVTMHDDGIDGDKIAGDHIYSVQLPGSMQVHRRLIRYRITVADNGGRALMVPYFDDPQPNFAYFVYDGVPPWYGAVRPGSTAVVEYGTDVMQSLPVYHLISKRSDVEACTWIESYGGSEYKWLGTMVYDGKVYDHIRYRARGGVWRYSMGKNMWKFDFNRGHSFQARDDYGKKYDTKWDKINFSACIQQGDYQHRGEQGMFEAATFKLFNMMGVESPKTNWIHFRIIDEISESGPTQYNGDFWGLYMTIEQMDGRFLDEHKLPDGNLYKIESNSGDLNNQGPTQVTDGSDLRAFMNGYNSRPSEAWWNVNVNLKGYYGYRCVVEGVHHGDIGYGKNWFFYINPETNKWSMLPWDVDLTWANNMYGNGEDTFKSQGRIFSNSNILIEYQNRLREFHDLLYNSDQLYQVLDDLADIIDRPTGGPTFVEADRAMWDYNPIMTSSYINRSKAGQGRFYQQAATKDFRGMVQIMKDYVVSNHRAFDTYYEDPSIPNTPVVTATCPSTYPINSLTFETSPFSDPQGSSTFASMKWRIAEVSEGSQVALPDEDIKLISDDSEWKYFKGTQEASSPDTTAWRQLDFDDSLWQTGPTPIGWGEPDTFLGTTLQDMRYAYTSFFIRKKFTVDDLTAIDNLVLEAMYDDGFNVWINGTFVLQENMPAENVSYDDYASGAHSSEKSWFTFALPKPTYLVDGENIITIQVQNMSRTSSSDCFIDVRLTGKPAEPGSVTPTYQVGEGKYEIDPVWETEETTDFVSDIKIPATEVKVGRTYRVRCRVKDTSGRTSHWSAPQQFVTGEPVAAYILNNLRITEVMYDPAEPPANDPADNQDFEFIELQNIGDETIDLTSVSFADGITFDFNNGKVTTLGPGQFVLVVANQAAFESRYGTGLSAMIAGEYSGKLSNNGENISLVDYWNGTVAQFAYNDARGWPLSAAGGGHSLVPLISALPGEPDGSLNYGGNWRASTYIGGSPGTEDPEPQTSVVLNEIMAHTDFSDPQFPQHDSDDWIELYNTTSTTINLNHWYLSDDIHELKKWSIGSVDIAGNAQISFDEVTGFHNPISTGFGLNKAGEQVILSYLPGTAEDRVVDSVRFNAQLIDASLGRYPDGGKYWLAMTPSLDSANNDPVQHIVIDEIMYHPADDTDDEYVELYNPTASTIYLENPDGSWRLDGAVDYILPANTSINAGSSLLIVGFDPATDIARLNTFKTTYNAGPLTAGVDIVGPWSGNLSNSGERLTLKMPEAPDAPDDPVCWANVDEAIFSDVSPWPTMADGSGAALQRIYADQYHSGNDPANWEVGSPTPGSNP
jgi:spore coat protein CotH